LLVSLSLRFLGIPFGIPQRRNFAILRHSLLRGYYWRGIL